VANGNNDTMTKADLQDCIDQATQILTDAYVPEASREDLAAAIGDALAALEGTPARTTTAMMRTTTTQTDDLRARKRRSAIRALRYRSNRHPPPGEKITRKKSPSGSAMRPSN